MYFLILMVGIVFLTAVRAVAVTKLLTSGIFFINISSFFLQTLFICAFMIYVN